MSVEAWLSALDERHLADLTPAEVTRALRALSSCYVERREKLARGGALDGAGKRAAFALFYGPQHFFVTREIVRAIWSSAPGPGRRGYDRVLDLGCGTGTAGAGAALEAGARSVEGIDLNPWAVREANWTYRVLGLNGRADVASIARTKLRVSRGTLVLAAYAVNELPEPTRLLLLEQLVEAQTKGGSILVVEPIGRRLNPWWRRWDATFAATGGRHDEWRFPGNLPPRQRGLAKAAGLEVRELTARSLYLPGRPMLSE